MPIAKGNRSIRRNDSDVADLAFQADTVNTDTAVLPLKEGGRTRQVRVVKGTETIEMETEAGILAQKHEDAKTEAGKTISDCQRALKDNGEAMVKAAKKFASKRNGNGRK